MFPLKDNVPTRSFPVVTVALIAANAAVWIFYQLPDLEGSVVELAYQPCEVVASCPPGTAVGESWAVTSFGNNVEDALGKLRFLVFYLLSGYAATALQTFVTVAVGTPVDEAIPNLGASGAVSGVLGAYLVLLPTASVLTLVFFFLIEVPAFLFLGFWFLFQLWEGGFSLAMPQAGGGVAFFAHIGGFVFGALTVRLFMKRPPLQPAY